MRGADRDVALSRMGVPPVWLRKQGCSPRVRSQPRVSGTGSTHAPVSGVRLVLGMQPAGVFTVAFAGCRSSQPSSLN